MAYKKNERTLAADIETSLLNSFEKQWKKRGQVQKRAVAAALRLWISLPEDLQARLISRELGQNDFLSIVRQTIKEYIKIYQQELPESTRKKPTKKTREKTKSQPPLPTKP
jgi:hypothetical protein